MADLRALPGLKPDGYTAPCPLCGGQLVIDGASVDSLRLLGCPNPACSPAALHAKVAEVLREVASQSGPPVFETVEELLSRCGKGTKWLLEPFIPAGAFVLVQGAPKGGKTFFASWAAVIMAVADAGHRLGFVEEEGSVDTLGERFRPFVPEGSVIGQRLMVAHRKGFRLDNPHRVDALIKWAKALRLDCIVLDPFKALHNCDEQNATEMGPVLDAIQRIITETGCALVLVHHTKKGASWDKGDSGPAQSQDARGTGAIIGAVDHIIAIKGVAPSEREVGKIKFIVECPDSRVCPPFDKRMAVVDLAGGPRSMTFTDTPGGEAKVESILERLLEAMPAWPEIKGAVQLRKVLECGKGPLDKAINLGCERSLLRRVQAKGVQRWS